jgi:hypothetical protein
VGVIEDGKLKRDAFILNSENSVAHIDYCVCEVCGLEKRLAPGFLMKFDQSDRA